MKSEQNQMKNHKRIMSKVREGACSHAPFFIAEKYRTNVRKSIVILEVW